MPRSFGVSLLDRYSAPPTQGGVVLLESSTTSDAERLLYECLDETPVLYIDPAATDHECPRHIRTSNFTIDTDAAWFYPSFDAFTRDPPQQSALSNAATIIVDGIGRFDRSGTEIIAACERLLEEMPDAYVLVHLHTDLNVDEGLQYELRRQSDLVARVTVCRDGDGLPHEFLIQKNRFDDGMNQPIPIAFQSDTLAPSPATETTSGTTPRGMSPGAGEPTHTSDDPPQPAPVTTDENAPQSRTGESSDHQQTKQGDSASTDSFGFEAAFASTTVDPNETADHTYTQTHADSQSDNGHKANTQDNTPDADTDNVDAPDHPENPTDAPPGGSKDETVPSVQDGNTRAKALLNDYGIRSKFDVEEMEWRPLLALASALDVAPDGGDRDAYESAVKSTVNDILSGDAGVDSPASFIAAISRPLSTQSMPNPQNRA